MDNSRDVDLRELHKRFNDPNVPMHKRQRAHKAFLDIQRQVTDRTLVELRHRLIRATIAEDADAAERLELQIREHERKSGYQKW